MCGPWADGSQLSMLPRSRARSRARQGCASTGSAPMCSWQSRQGPPRASRLRRVQLWGFPAPVRCERPGERRIGAMQGAGARRRPIGCPADRRLHRRRRPALVLAGRGGLVAPCGSCCSALNSMRGRSQVRMRIRGPAGKPAAEVHLLSHAPVLEARSILAMRLPLQATACMPAARRAP